MDLSRFVIVIRNICPHFFVLRWKFKFIILSLLFSFMDKFWKIMLLLRFCICCNWYCRNRHKSASLAKFAFFFSFLIDFGWTDLYRSRLLLAFTRLSCKSKKRKCSRKMWKECSKILSGNSGYKTAWSWFIKLLFSDNIIFSFFLLLLLENNFWFLIHDACFWYFYSTWVPIARWGILIG